MTSQGTAHGRFSRAIQRRDLFSAELAARELGGLGWHEALDLCVLIADAKPERFPRAAIRWHGRLELEAPTLTLGEAQLALAALAHLPQGGPEVQELLRRLLRQARPTLLRRTP
jgi:hypothetical protein